MRKVILFLFILALCCLWIQCEDSWGQERCGRWVKLGNLVNVILTYPEIYCYQVTVPASDPIYDSVQCDGKWIQFVKGWDTWIDSHDSTLRWYHWDLPKRLFCDSCFLITECVEPDTACWHWEERWEPVIRWWWEYDDHFEVVTDSMGDYLIVKNDTLFWIRVRDRVNDENDSTQKVRKGEL